MLPTRRMGIYLVGLLLALAELSVLTVRAGSCALDGAPARPPALRLERLLLLHDARLVLSQNDAEGATAAARAPR